MTEGEIWNCYHSWRGTVIQDHNVCHTSICNMDQLYKSLFPNHQEYIRKGRNELSEEIYKGIEIEDIKFIV